VTRVFVFYAHPTAISRASAARSSIGRNAACAPFRTRLPSSDQEKPCPRWSSASSVVTEVSKTIGSF